MHTVLAPSPQIQYADSDYTARPGGHPDEGFTFTPDDDALMAQLDHEQAVDCGIDAIGDDLAAAEDEVKANHPGASFYASFQIHRLDGRNFIRWNVNITRSPVSVTGSGATLRDALDDAYNTLALPPRAA